MRDPDFRRRDRSRVDDVFFELCGLESVVFAIFDFVDWRRRLPVALLIACGENSGLRIIAEVGLAEACRDDFVRKTVRRYLHDGAVGDTPGRTDLAAFGEVETTSFRGNHVHRELAGFGGLRYDVGKILIPVGFAVAVGVMKANDPVPVRDVDFTFDDRDGFRFVKAGGKACPDRLGTALGEAIDDPDVAIEGAENAASIREKIEAGEADVSFPRVRDRKGEVIENKRGVG